MVQWSNSFYNLKMSVQNIFGLAGLVTFISSEIWQVDGICMLQVVFGLDDDVDIAALSRERWTYAQICFF